MKRDPICMKNDMLKTFYSKKDLEETVARLGKEITEDYRGKTPVMVAVLKGAFILSKTKVSPFPNSSLISTSHSERSASEGTRVRMSCAKSASIMSIRNTARKWHLQ